MAEAERKPREYLDEMDIGFENGICVSPAKADTFRNTASKMKMYGKVFSTEMVEGGMNIWRVK
jgi:hypothetical protein